MNNPAIHLVIGRESGVMYEGTIKKGERAAFGAFTVSFEDIRDWVEFLIVREYGKYPLVTGFVMAAIGLIMRLVFYQKRLRMAIEYENDKQLLYIDGKSEYFRYSFEDEMNTLVNELEVFLRKEK